MVGGRSRRVMAESAGKREVGRLAGGPAECSPLRLLRACRAHAEHDLPFTPLPQHLLAATQYDPGVRVR